MKPRTIAARSAPLSFVGANGGQTPEAGFTADFQDLFDLGMKQIVCLNSCMLEISRNAFLFTSVPGNLFDTADESFAFCMELQQNWLAMLMPRASSLVASSSGSQAQPTPDELAHYMDIAIGERFTAPGRTFASSSGRQAKQTAKAQTTAEVPERSIDIAIGAGVS